jgi:hypothetical protein
MNPDSNSEVFALQRQMFSLLIALLIVSGTVTTYLYRQASIINKDIEAVKPQAQQVIGVFNQNQALMVSFLNQLVTYSQTHPDFRPILLKYGINPTAVPPKK